MFIGHYGLAFILKKKAKEIPLWLIFVSVQLVDFLCFLLIILKIEKMKFLSNPNPWLRTHLEYFPFSHSLFTNIVLALIVFFVFWKFKNKLWGIILSIGVISHWIIDFVVHTPDLPLFFTGIKVGLGLWQLPWAAFFLEIILAIFGGWYLYKNSGRLFRPIILISLMLLVLSGMFFAQDPEIAAKNMTMRAVIPLVVNSIFAALAYWTERKNNLVNENKTG